MVETLDIDLVAAEEQLEHLEPVERLALVASVVALVAALVAALSVALSVALLDARAQSSSFEVQHQLKGQPIVVALLVANIQMLDLMAVVYLKRTHKFN